MFAKFVEIEGQKFEADDNGQAKLNDKGEKVPYVEQKPADDGTKKDGDESGLVKHLRSEVDKRDGEIEKLRKQVQDAGNLGMTPEQIKEKLEKVDRLEFENNIAKKAPQLADKAADIFALRQKFPNATVEELIGFHLGQDLIKNQADEKGTQGHSISTRTISVGGKEKKLDELTNDELAEIARKEFESGRL